MVFSIYSLKEKSVRNEDEKKYKNEVDENRR